MGELKWHELDDAALAKLDRIAAGWHAREGAPCSRETAVERLIEVGATMAETGARLYGPRQLRAAAMTNSCASYVLALVQLTDLRPVVTGHKTDDGAYLAVRAAGSDDVLQQFPDADYRLVQTMLEGWGAASTPVIEIPDTADE